MKSRIFSFLKIFLPFCLLLFVVQWGVKEYFLENLSLYYSTAGVYSFHIIATLLIYLFLIFVHNNFQEYTGFAFMGIGLLKMLAAVLFLFPMLTSEVDNIFQNILFFFIPYFLFLIFETIYAVKLLNAK